MAKKSDLKTQLLSSFIGMHHRFPKQSDPVNSTSMVSSSDDDTKRGQGEQMHVFELHQREVMVPIGHDMVH